MGAGKDQRTVALAIASEGAAPATSRVQESKVQAQEPKTDVTIKGVLVTSLTPKSDARRAGITQGDIIVEYDGVRISPQKNS